MDSIFVIKVFQSTLLREERHDSVKKGLVDKWISIHAPARGATEQTVLHGNKRDISIHAPARGATQLRIIIQGSVEISIHAPARGAT